MSHLVRLRRSSSEALWWPAPVRKILSGAELDGAEHFEKKSKEVPGDAGSAAGATAGAAAASAAAIDATTTFVVVKTMAAAEAAAAAPAVAPAAAPASPGTFLHFFSKFSAPSSSGPSNLFLKMIVKGTLRQISCNHTGLY